jgi:signal transduction histidine kinase
MTSSAGNTSDFFSRKRKEIGIISIVLITVSSFGLFFYQQNITEQNVKNSIFTQYKDRQIESTQIIAERISSDLKLIMAVLQGISDSTFLHQHYLYGEKIEKIMQEKFSEVNNITKVDGLFIADENNIVTTHIVSKGQRSFVNIDISIRDYIQETRNTQRPVFSDGYKGIDNIQRITLAVPIVNSDTGEHIGIVGAEIPTEAFFAHYGNIVDIDSQFIVAYDSKFNYIATPRTHFLGKNFFDNEVQKFFNSNNIQNDYYRKVFSGELLDGNAVYDFGSGERLNTGSPILLQEKSIYFIFIITPTTLIYSHINDVLNTERVKGFSLIVGTIIAITILIIFLIKWNVILNNEVKKRTKELQESNREIALANKELKVHDKIQKEFINVAAHELRTPIMPILGLSELLYNKVLNKKGNNNLNQETLQEYLQIIVRNSHRLHRLVEAVLDVTKIESRVFKLNTELVELNEVIANVVTDFENSLENKSHGHGGGDDDDDGNNNKVKIIYVSNNRNKIFVNADKIRLTQVIFNLLDNASKFTKEGFIIITTRITTNKEKADDGNNNNNNNVIVIIKDSGIGIDNEILPRLFTKFATKSDHGTGLGLFIVKNIIEAHGGRIWAENNSNGIGSTFYFTLPIAKTSEIVINGK